MKTSSYIEKKTLAAMMSIYCRGNHHAGRGLCPACAELLDYVHQRLDQCPLDPKPGCRICPVYCYRKDQRRRIKEIMRYVGPRMLLRHPLLSLRHYLP